MVFPGLLVECLCLAPVAHTGDLVFEKPFDAFHAVDSQRPSATGVTQRRGATACFAQFHRATCVAQFDSSCGRPPGVGAYFREPSYGLDLPETRTEGVQQLQTSGTKDSEITCHRSIFLQSAFIGIIGTGIAAIGSIDLRRDGFSSIRAFKSFRAGYAYG